MKRVNSACMQDFLLLSLLSPKRRQVVRLEFMVRQIQVRCTAIEMNWKTAQITWWRRSETLKRSVSFPRVNVSVLNAYLAWEFISH